MESILIYCEAENILSETEAYANSKFCKINWDKLFEEIKQNRDVLVERIYAPDQSFLGYTSNSIFKPNRIGSKKRLINYKQKK